MAGKGTLIRLFGLLSLLLVLSRPATSDAVNVLDCKVVVADVRPCLDYVTDKSDAPSAECCNGLKKLIVLVKTKEDRIAACECIKSAAAGNKFDLPRIATLRKTCGIAIHLPPFLSATAVDCTKV